MIQLCPFCGYDLAHPLKDGIADCRHCSRVFDSCAFNRLLSAGWLIRRKNYDNPYQLIGRGITMEESEIALSLMLDNLSHEEYFKALLKKGISQIYQICPSNLN